MFLWLFASACCKVGDGDDDGDDNDDGDDDDDDDDDEDDDDDGDDDDDDDDADLYNATKIHAEAICSMLLKRLHHQV